MTTNASPDGGLTGRGAISKILLATDLSHASDIATDWAFDLARGLGASLLVVSVIDPRDLRLPGGRFWTRVDQVRERREAAAQTLVQRGGRMGIAVTFLVWDGDPGESIVAVAHAEQADLLLVGSHGRGSLGRLLLGSVSEYVVRNAPCPVLVARAVVAVAQPVGAVRPTAVS
ncbi:MAG: universal stress protein [Chloroflexota bacterium]|nr:universal stress protein [Chloroflexota bacterium]